MQVREIAGEVCVVGSGPVGLIVATRLAREGREVIVLESGTGHSSASCQVLNKGEVEGIRYAGLEATRHRQIGGTANIWDVRVRRKAAAKYVPLAPGDLTGWPIEWEDLVPWYELAQQSCGLGAFRYDAGYGSSDRFQPLKLAETGLESRIYQFGPAEQFTRKLPQQLRQIQKGSLLGTTTVVGLDLDARAGQVRSLRAVTRNGTVIRIAAQVIVLAAGAIENARLLLLSGLGREGRLPWLGRGFMEHARDFSLRLEPASPRLFEEAVFYDLHRATDGTELCGCLVLKESLRQELGFPNLAMSLVPSLSGHAKLGRIGKALRRLRMRNYRPGHRYGWSTLQSPAEFFDGFRIVLNLEQRPAFENGIRLGGQRDRFGNQLPVLRVAWTEAEQVALERLRSELGRRFEASGIGRLVSKPGPKPDLRACHHAGTTRMGSGPGDGVVDANGRVLDCQNLYLAGSSVFPTAGYANPTLTAVALAHRLADHVNKHL